MKRIFIGGLLLSALGLIACNDKLDIQTAYDYQLTTWLLPGTIKTGEPVEIRFTLTREGDYRETEYFVSWIQLEGQGRVTDAAGVTLDHRELYDLRELIGYDPSDALRQTFILYYTNETDKRAALRFVVTDNQGQQRELEISFDPDTE